MACSTDGYCSFVIFEEGELGVPIAKVQEPGEDKEEKMVKKEDGM